MLNSGKSDSPSMGKYAPLIIVFLLLAIIATVLYFFSLNPSRVGEVTVATPGGPTITVKVAESNEISELIRAGLDNEKTAESMTNSLLSIIESLPPKSKLSEKLIGLVEQRKP